MRSNYWVVFFKRNVSDERTSIQIRPNQSE